MAYATSEEIAKMQESIDVTKGALENVLCNIKPGLYEYQIQETSSGGENS